MEPKYVDRPAFWVLGVEIQAEPSKADYDDLWMKRFMPRHDEIRKLAVDDRYYAVYSAGDEPGVDRILAGMSVSGEVAVPDGLRLRELPAAREAVFETTMGEIGATWQRIFGEWLSETGNVPALNVPSYECYPAETDGAPESPLTIHLAIG